MLTFDLLGVKAVGVSHIFNTFKVLFVFIKSLKHTVTDDQRRNLRGTHTPHFRSEDTV